jgi:hypothetical protein
MSLVNIFVFLLPLKNIVPGKKRIFEGGKEISLGKFFSTSQPLRDGKVEKNFPREFTFPPSNILFFPGQYFSAGIGKQNCSPGQFSFHDTNIVFTSGDGKNHECLFQAVEHTQDSFRMITIKNETFEKIIQKFNFWSILPILATIYEVKITF